MNKDVTQSSSYLYEEFIKLVAKMRFAQEEMERAMAESDDYSETAIYISKAESYEKLVDDWVMKYKYLVDAKYRMERD